MSLTYKHSVDTHNFGCGDKKLGACPPNGCPVGYLGYMTKIPEGPTRNPGLEAEFAEGVLASLEDQTSGRRTMRWLSERADMRYSTVKDKLKNRPGFLTLSEQYRIADAIGLDVVDIIALGREALARRGAA